MRSRRLILSLLLVLAVPLHSSEGQGLILSRPPSHTIIMVQPRRQAVYTSPLSLFLLGAYSLEYERVVAPTFTIGAGATFEDSHSVTFSADAGYDFDASVKLRYYPEEDALDGYLIALLAGGTLYQRPNSATDIFTGSPTHSNSAATIGFSLDKNRLLGRERRILLGYGAGAKRRFVQHPTYADKFDPNRLTLRLVLGYAF